MVGEEPDVSGRDGQQKLVRADVGTGSWAQEVLTLWKDGRAAIERLQPGLRAGRLASEARYGLDVSEFDGWLALQAIRQIIVAY